MATYSLTFEGLSETVTQIRNISTQINTLLEELNSGTLRAITEWNSGARTEFDTQRANWSSAAADMTTQANAAGAALVNILDEYNHGETYGIQLWAR